MDMIIRNQPDDIIAHAKELTLAEFLAKYNGFGTQEELREVYSQIRQERGVHKAPVAIASSAARCIHSKLLR